VVKNYKEYFRINVATLATGAMTDDLAWLVSGKRPGRASVLHRSRHGRSGVESLAGRVRGLPAARRACFWCKCWLIAFRAAYAPLSANYFGSMMVQRFILLKNSKRLPKNSNRLLFVDIFPSDPISKGFIYKILFIND